MFAPAGDFNGDGFDDIAVGNPEAEFSGISNGGEAYLIFGTPSFATGDFSANGELGPDDLDLLVQAILDGQYRGAYDLTGDNVVDHGDLQFWVESLRGTRWGDTNLDLQVDATDLNAWTANQFRATGLWSQGDWNADGVTDVSDFNLWYSNRFLGTEIASSKGEAATATRRTPRSPLAQGSEERVVDHVFAQPILSLTTLSRRAILRPAAFDVSEFRHEATTHLSATKFVWENGRRRVVLGCSLLDVESISWIAHLRHVKEIMDGIPSHITVPAGFRNIGPGR